MLQTTQRRHNTQQTRRHTTHVPVVLCQLSCRALQTRSGHAIDMEAHTHASSTHAFHDNRAQFNCDVAGADDERSTRLYVQSIFAVIVFNHATCASERAPFLNQRAATIRSVHANFGRCVLLLCVTVCRAYADKQATTSRVRRCDGDKRRRRRRVIKRAVCAPSGANPITRTHTQTHTRAYKIIID